ncbi:MAG: hypothetical protein NXI22_01655 [bacterium]|nr:hypothetical protein [bacterium]
MHRFFAASFCAVALCWLQGCCCPCVPVGIPNLPNVPNVQTGDDGATITFPTEEGEFKMGSGMNVELPDDFPADVPVYPNAKVVNSLDLAGNLMVTFVSEDSAGDIVAFYETGLVENGWELTANAKAAQGANLIGQKKEEKRTVSATIGTDQNAAGTTITLAASRKEKASETE